MATAEAGGSWLRNVGAPLIKQYKKLLGWGDMKLIGSG